VSFNQSKRVCWRVCVKMSVASIPQMKYWWCVVSASFHGSFFQFNRKKERKQQKVRMSTKLEDLPHLICPTNNFAKYPNTNTVDTFISCGILIRWYNLYILILNYRT